MELTQEQKITVAQWIEEGLKLSEIQERMGAEWGIRMTYMEARFLIDDLRLLPKDSAAAETPQPAVANSPSATSDGMLPPLPGEELPGGQEGLPAEPAPGGGVTLKVDTLMRPGAMVSGSVCFSDGQTAQWYLDQFGRMGMVPPSPGYRPPQQDIPQFQVLLDRELSRMGM
jgi:hypothetical protein